MGQSGSRAGGNDGQSNEERKEKKKSKYEQPAPTRVGKKKKKKPGPAPSAKVPTIVPASKCKLRLLKLERVKDYLLMEEEFVARQEQVKPQEETAQEERTKVDDIRGSPMGVASLEEMIDDNHAIISSSVGPEYYVNIMSFVDKDQLEPGCSVLLNHKVHAVVGVLGDDTDPMVAVMKLEKAPSKEKKGLREEGLAIVRDQRSLLELPDSALLTDGNPFGPFIGPSRLKKVLSDIEISFLLVH